MFDACVIRLTGMQESKRLNHSTNQPSNKLILCKAVGVLKLEIEDER